MNIKSESTKKTEVLSALALWAILTAFFGIGLPSHIAFHENYSLFQFSWGYLNETLRQPGGLASYIGAFFTQFFVIPWVGAALLSTLLVLVQVLCWRLSRCRGTWLFPLTFIPTLLLTAFYCDENAMVSALVAIIAGCAALALLRKIDKVAISCVLLPVMFMAFGSLSLLVLLPAFTKKKLSLLAGLAIAILCPVTASVAFNYPLSEIAEGLQYHMSSDFPLLAWAATAVIAIISVLPEKMKSTTLLFVSSCALAILIGAIAIFSNMKKTNSVARELAFKYAFLIRDRRWDDILTEYKKDKSPKELYPIIVHNLALGEKGRLLDDIFKYQQAGTEGLIPKYHLDYFLPSTLSEIYYQLGLINEARRYASEAQQSIPHFQKSASCLKMLAVTSHINGEDAVAEKYLNVLKHTLFYRKWAKPESLEDCSTKAATRLDTKDLFDNEADPTGLLEALYSKNSGNSLAKQYLYCYMLLNADLQNVVSLFESEHKEGEAIPDVLAEALLIQWTTTHSNFDGIPWNLPDEMKDRCSAFMGDVMAKKSKVTLQKSYGDTYWFYFLYNQKHK